MVFFLLVKLFGFAPFLKWFLNSTLRYKFKKDKKYFEVVKSQRYPQWPLTVVLAHYQGAGV
jgi:hypothetical protein